MNGATLTLTYDEALDESSAPAPSTFTVTVGGNDRGVESVDISGSAVTLTLASAVISEDVVVVSYAAQATNETVPSVFTASIHDAPESHDGQTSFTFELRFSEAPKKGFSYKTLRDHAFTVTGGSVTRAVRVEKGNNIRWTIHVVPDSDSDVTVVPLVTTDCEAQGSICTGDARMLSNRLEITVSGPGRIGRDI